MTNLRKHFEKNRHIRDLSTIDFFVSRGWEHLAELEFHYSEWYYVKRFL